MRSEIAKHCLAYNIISGIGGVSSRNNERRSEYVVVIVTGWHAVARNAREHRLENKHG